MNYNNLNKSQLWQLVKCHENQAYMTGLTWQSPKSAMIACLIEADNSTTQPSSDLPSSDFSLWDEVLNDVGIIIDSVPPTKDATVSPTSTKSTFSQNQCDNKTPLDKVTLEYSPLPDTAKRSTQYNPPKSEPLKNPDLPKRFVTTNPSSSNTRLYTWSYLDHEMSGRWNEVKSVETIEQYVEFLTELQKLDKDHSCYVAVSFPVNNTVISVKMKPSIVTELGTNDQKLRRIEKKAQKNNDFGNRAKTKMSVTDTPGKHAGESAVHASVLFERARFIPSPIRKNDGSWNYENIDTVSINGTQVYPCSLVAAYSENEVTNSLVPTKVLHRRNAAANKRVEGKAFYHARGKIQNGLSPSFKDGNKTFCFQIDSNNRVSLWLLANDTQHIVSTNDLIKGRKLYDVGFLEVQPYQYTEWQNVTMDLVRGGVEARLERFSWIKDRLNKQYLESNEAIHHYLSQLKNKDGEGIVITNLQVTDNRISGELYGSKLLIVKKQITKHKVVFHPVSKSSINFGDRYKFNKAVKVKTVEQSNTETLDKIIAMAQTWLFSLPSKLLSEMYGEREKAPKHWDSVIGVNANNRPKISQQTTGEKYRVRSEKDKKYLVKLLTQFCNDGIYSDKTRSVYLGKLVKTNGDTISSEQIDRIAQRVLDLYPVDQKIATLFTPSHANNLDEWKVSFLNLLKVYGQRELAILYEGKLQQYNTGNELLTDWCRGMTNYLKSMRVAVDVLTIQDAIELLENAPTSPIKEILLKVPTVAQLNKSERLLSYVPDMVVTPSKTVPPMYYLSEDGTYKLKPEYVANLSKATSPKK